MKINRHFKKKSKLMVWIFCSIPVLGFIAALILPTILDSLDAYKCVDDGGSFNYEICKCDFDENHSYKENHICR